MKTTLSRTLVLAALLIACGAANAAAAINTLAPGLFSDRVTGTAIRGYDTVAYFSEGAAVEGSETITAEWHGATWRFASAANRDRFVADPEAYAPQYGGYCAYGVALGDLLRIDGEAFAIVDGKLYLNYDENWLGRWRADAVDLIAEADRRFGDLVAD